MAQLPECWRNNISINAVDDVAVPFARDLFSSAFEPKLLRFTIMNRANIIASHLVPSGNATKCTFYNGFLNLLFSCLGLFSSSCCFSESISGNDWKGIFVCINLIVVAHFVIVQVLKEHRPSIDAALEKWMPRKFDQQKYALLSGN